MTQNKANRRIFHLDVDAAYVVILDALLQLKGSGIRTDALAAAIARAAREAGVEAIR